MAEKVKIVVPRDLRVTLIVDEFNIADALRDLADFIEENELDYSKNPRFEGDEYEGDIQLV